MKNEDIIEKWRFNKNNKIFENKDVLRILNRIGQLELDKEKYLENYLNYMKEEYGVGDNRKRFRLEKNSDQLVDTITNKRYLYAKEAKVLLNRLHEENSRLIDILNRLRLEKKE